MRSPVMGFNHNILHLGWLFHVQTEDSGVQAPHVITHLFQRGTILATRKSGYDPALAADRVKTLMQDQHKVVLRELRDGALDARIRDFLGQAPAIAMEMPESPALPVEALPALPSPAPARLEWSDDLLTDPGVYVPAPAATEHPATAAGGVHLVGAVFDSADALLEAYYANGGLGGVAVDTDVPALPGDRATLDLHVRGERPLSLTTSTTVEWRSGADTVGFAFPSLDHVQVRRLVLEARGARAPRRKGGPRPVYGTGYVVAWLPGGRRLECVADVTERGLFIAEDLGVTPGASVPVMLRALDGLPAARLHTLVEWLSPATDGAGLRFVLDDEDRAVARRWLDALLAH